MAQTIRAYRVRQATGPTGQPYENLVFADPSSRIPSGQTGATAGLWDDCPLLPFLSDPSYAISYETTFLGSTATSDAIGGWTTTKATSGAVTIDATKGLKIDAGAVTAGQGVNLQMIQTAFTPTTNKPIWMEGKILFGTLASLKIQFLFGLAAAQTALITSNAVGTDDKAAFDGVTTTGVITTDTTTATATTATGFTIVSATAYKLGMKLTPTACDFWVNGVKVGTSVATLPVAALAPSIVVQGNATVQPIAYLQWLRVFQPR